MPLPTNVKDERLTTITTDIRVDLQYGTTMWPQTWDHLPPTSELCDIETWRMGLSGRTVYVQRTTNGLDWPVIRVGEISPLIAERAARDPAHTGMAMAQAIRRHGDHLALLAYHLRESRHDGQTALASFTVDREWDSGEQSWYVTIAPVALANTTLAPEADAHIVIASGKDRMAEAVGRILPGIGHDDLRRLVRKVRDVNAAVAEQCIRW